MFDYYILSGDCGGTNTRLQLIGLNRSLLKPFTGKKTPGTILKTVTFLNENYSGFKSILEEFLYVSKPVISTLPKVCVLAAAGPVNQNKVLFTNNGWLISGSSIVENFGGKGGIEKAILVNDFVGAGYGVLTVEREECRVLNDVERIEGAPIACVGAGTGLGECYLTAGGGDPEKYECYASEGGHAEFAPRTEIEFELLRHLRQKFSSRHRVSVERVVSGTGLSNVYEFFAEKYSSKRDPNVYEEFKNAGSMKGKVVSVNSSKCVCCEMSMKVFAGAYGSEVGVAGLKWIPRGGLYVTGGLTPKNIKWIEGEQSEFMQAFRDKGRVSELLEEIPVYAVMVEDLGLRGSHRLAWKILKEEVEGEGGEGGGGVKKSWAAGILLAGVVGVVGICAVWGGRKTVRISK
ncbi:hypothetical protein TrST_g10083 [Triparma strigata]|uniref:Glucokinase n=1 Tax=Triparma strigata TaxID=1606541 RepID=A0A9W7AP58_9STRA|nr:hypothetical protein TrST_g10083 [Triparma strigata]